MPAIVLGLDLNGLGVLRALGRSGIPVIGVDHSLSHVGRASRFCRQVVRADPCSEASLLEALRQIGRGLDGPGVLFPTMDDTVRILSRAREELTDCFRLALPRPCMVRRLMEKVDLAELGKAHQWPVPITVVCHSEKEVVEVAPKFPYPGVMKPGRRELHAPRGLPQKLWAFENPAELLDAYRVITRWESIVVLQEMIPGPDSAVFFCLFYADRGACPRVLFVGRKIRQFPPLFGSTSSAEPAEEVGVQEFASQFIRDVSYHGLGSVEMKVDSRSGTLKFIEPTVGRTDYQSFLAVANGFNIPEIAYRDLAGLPAVAARPQRRPVKFIVGISDVRSALQQIGKGRDSWRGYLRSLRGRKVFALFQGNDPGPFLYRIHYATVGRLARMAKRAVRRIARALTPHSGP